MSSSAEALLAAAYRAFNARDIDAALALLHTDVEWPNGMEGGWVHGHSGVREYWTRQWEQLDPRVEPQLFNPLPDGRVAVTVHQVVRDLGGTVLDDQLVRHVYELEDGLIARMQIQRY
jgi:hypothetical protein